MLAYLYFIGIAQGLLLCLHFYKKRKADASFYQLSSLLVAITAMIAGQLLVAKNLQISFWHLFLVSTGMVFLIGPLLYLFIRQKLKSGNISYPILLHFIPAALYYLLLAYAAFPFTPDHLQALIAGSTPAAGNQGLPLFGILKLLHILCYTMLSFRLVRSQEKKADWQPVRYFILGYILLQGVAWLMLGLSVFVENSLLAVTDHTVSVLLVVYVYLLGYMCMGSPGIFASARLPAVKKYMTTGLEREASAQIYRKLTVLMEEESPYLNPSLTLNELAAQLSIKPHQLSQAINENAETNFSDFINSYRVEKVKQYLAEARSGHLTLLAIGFNAGFNNKNSFNAAFKKHAGQTPTAYRKALI